MRCAGFSSSFVSFFFFFFFTQTCRFRRGTKRRDGETQRGPRARRERETRVTPSALECNGTFSRASIKRRFSRSGGRTRRCRCVRHPTKGVDKRCSSRRSAALRASGSASTLPFLSAWFVFSISGVVIVERAKSILGAAGTSFERGPHKGEGEGGASDFGARTLSPPQRPVHLEVDAPTASKHAGQTVEQRNKEASFPRMFLCCRRLCCPFGL